jgi:hypothetical protein
MSPPRTLGKKYIQPDLQKIVGKLSETEDEMYGDDSKIATEFVIS